MIQMKDEVNIDVTHSCDISTPANGMRPAQTFLDCANSVFSQSPGIIRRTQTKENITREIQINKKADQYCTYKKLYISFVALRKHSIKELDLFQKVLENKATHLLGRVIKSWMLLKLRTSQIKEKTLFIQTRIMQKILLRWLETTIRINKFFEVSSRSSFVILLKSIFSFSCVFLLVTVFSLFPEI